MAGTSEPTLPELDLPHPFTCNEFRTCKFKPWQCTCRDGPMTGPADNTPAQARGTSNGTHDASPPRHPPARNLRRTCATVPMHASSPTACLTAVSVRLVTRPSPARTASWPPQDFFFFCETPDLLWVLCPVNRNDEMRTGVYLRDFLTTKNAEEKKEEDVDCEFLLFKHYHLD